MSVTVVTQIQRVVVRGSGASYSDARVLAYLRTILTTNGDLLTVASNTLARIGLGSSGQVLTVSGGAAVWAAPTGFANPMSAQGDLIIGGVSGAPTRLARGTNGQILSVSGSTLAWIDAPTSYTDADAIAAIAGEVTDHQLIQRQNGTGLQGISLSTIYDGAIDAIEALGNGVLVTAGGVLDNVVGTEGQVLTWTGGTAVFAAASGGYTDPLTTNGDLVARLGGVTTRLPIGTEGYALQVVSGLPAWAALPSSMTNPMTTAQDMIGGGVSGAPSRIAAPSTYGQDLRSLDGALSWTVPAPWLAWGAGRWSIGYAATATAAPSTVGTMGATWTRISSGTVSAGSVITGLGGATLQQCRTLSSVNSWAGWYALLGTPDDTWWTGGLTVVVRRVAATVPGNQRVFILMSHSFTSVSAIVTSNVPTVGGESINGFGLRIKGTQTNWEFVALNNTTPNAPVDTGIPFAVGDTHSVRIWQDASACHYEIFDASVHPWVRLGGGSISSALPASGQMPSRSMAASVGVINLSSSLESVQFALPALWLDAGGRLS